MKPSAPLTAKNLTTNETREINIDPRVYTSITDWKPIRAEQFAELLHRYMSSDAALDDFNHGQMHTTGLNLDRETEVHIHYLAKAPGDPVSSPVLMTMKRADMPVICFASTKFGAVALMTFEFDATKPAASPK